MSESTSAGSAEVEARLQVVISRTTQQLSEADQAALRQQIGHSLELRRSMRAMAVQNHDEPEHGFDPAAVALTKSEAAR